MLIVLDTNIINKQFFLQNSQIISMCKTADKASFQMAIPKVVFEEMVDHFRIKSEELTNDVCKSEKEYNKTMKRISLGIDLPNLPKEDEILKNYRDVFSKRLNELKIAVLPYPDIKPEKITERLFARRKPFRIETIDKGKGKKEEKEKGLKDVIIWETVLENLKKPVQISPEPVVAFITTNTHDFFKDGKLHPDLAANLTNENIQDNTFEIFSDLKSFMDKYITPMQEKLEELEADLNEFPEIGDRSIKEILEEKLWGEVESLIDNNYEEESSDIFSLSFDGELQIPEINDVDVYDFEISDVRRLPDDKPYISIKGESTIWLEGFLSKSWYWLNDGKLEPGMQIMKEDWNEEYMLVSLKRNVNFTAEFILDSSAQEILSDHINIEI